TQEFDIPVDTNGDGAADFIVFSDDFGLITTGDFSGQPAAFIFDLQTHRLSADFFAEASTDSSTILLPVLASSIGITAANPRFVYSAASFDLFSSNSDQLDTAASFNAFNSAISNGQFVALAPEESASVPVSIDATEFALTPAKGLMIVTPDNKN